MKAIVYRGWRRETPIHVKLILITPEIAQIDCIECDGSGWWGYGPTEECNCSCVECKGTGKVYVSC